MKYMYPLYLFDCIIFRLSIGVKLLRKMGWKEGQGLGPRISKKQRKLQSKCTNDLLDF